MRLLSALGHDDTAIPDNVEAAAELYRSTTADLALLVILDNARDVRQVRPLLPGSGAFTIITSRDRLTGLTVRDDAHPIRLTPLSSGESAALLARLVDDSDPVTALRLAELCGNLPLALRIAAARAREDPCGITGYVDELARSDRLGLLAVDGDTDSAVSANLDRSYRNLDSDARSVFCRIGSLPGEDVSAELVNEFSGLSEVDTDRAVSQLVSGHLLERHQSDRYRMHDLVRLYAKRRARSTLTDVERDRLVDGFIQWHHDRAYRTDIAEESNLFLAVDELSAHPKLWRLVLALRSTINRGRFTDRTRRIVDGALAQAQEADDVLGMFRMTGLLAHLAFRSGDESMASELGERAIRYAANLTAREQITAEGNLGVVLRSTGRLESSRHHLSRAVDLAMDAGVVRPLQIFGRSLVSSLCETGHTDAAQRYVNSIREVREAEWSEADRAILDLSVAEVLLHRGDYSESLNRVEAAIAFAQREGQHFLLAMTLQKRARVMYFAGWPELAMQDNEAEARLIQTHRMATMEPEILFHRAEILIDLGEYTEALSLVARIGTRGLIRTSYFQAQLALTRAEAQNRLGECELALGHARQALEAFRAMSWRAREEEARYAVARAHLSLGDVSAAETELTAANAIGAPINTGRLRTMVPGGVVGQL